MADDPTPREAGAQLANADPTPDTMTDDTDEIDDTHPSTAITDYADLHPRQQTRFEWSVLSLTDDEPTAHLVNTRELSCSCPDHTYSPADSTTVCKHLAAALAVAEMRADTAELSRWSLEHALRDAHDAVETVEALSKRMDGVLVQGRETAAQQPTASDSQAESTDSSTYNAEEDAAAAADRLQSAFDDVLEDMQVEANDGLVWFQTGQDTPEDWPFPGGDDTFSVITGPDSVMYVHDGTADWADSPHKHYESKPGQWFKNALAPEDVEDYVSEVLE